MNRRDFINASAAGVGVLLLGVGSGDVAAKTGATFDPYEQIPLGETGLTVSRLCQGTGMRGWMRESNHTRMGMPRFEALIRGGYERGVRFYDLADIYGTHAFFASAVEGLPRESYAIATKIWFRPSGVPEHERPDADVIVARFLKEIRTDYIDLLLLHCTVSGHWPVEERRQMDLLAALKEKGIIRAHGVSCHSLEALEAAAAEPWVDSVHTRINPYGLHMDGTPDQVVPVLRRLHEAGKGVVGMKLMGQGDLRNSDEKRDASVRYVLGLGCVDALNVGFETIEEIDDFAARVRKVNR